LTVLLLVFLDGSDDNNDDVSGLFCYFGHFLSLIGFDGYALLTNFFISCLLFATLASTAMILRISVIAMVGSGSRD
jgi:hypothetical protein